MQKNALFFGFHDNDLNSDHKWGVFNFRKGTEVLKEEISSGLFSAAYQIGDQYYDVGPLCPISRN